MLGQDRTVWNMLAHVCFDFIVLMHRGRMRSCQPPMYGDICTSNKSHTRRGGQLRRRLRFTHQHQFLTLYGSRFFVFSNTFYIWFWISWSFLFANVL